MQTLSKPTLSFSETLKTCKSLLAQHYGQKLQGVNAAARAYYAVFHGATALLLSKRLKFKSHTGVLRAINLNFIKPGTIDKHFREPCAPRLYS